MEMFRLFTGSVFGVHWNGTTLDGVTGFLLSLGQWPAGAPPPPSEESLHPCPVKWEHQLVGGGVQQPSLGSLVTAAHRLQTMASNDVIDEALGATHPHPQELLAGCPPLNTTPSEAASPPSTMQSLEALRLKAQEYEHLVSMYRILSLPDDVLVKQLEAVQSCEERRRRLGESIKGKPTPS